MNASLVVSAHTPSGKLGSSIFNEITETGSVEVRVLGVTATDIAIKGMTAARKFLQPYHDDLVVIPRKIWGTTICSGISFFVVRMPTSMQGGIYNPTHSLLYGCTNTQIEKLAGAVAHRMRTIVYNPEPQVRYINLRAMGCMAITRSAQALCKARNFLEKEPADLIFIPEFVELDIQGEGRTALNFIVVAMPGEIARIGIES